MSQAELARRIGVAQATIANLVRERSAGSKHLHAIARELRTTPAYLSGETDDPSEGAQRPPTEHEIAEHFDLVPIKEIDFAYGMGGTFADEADAAEVAVHHFPRLWVDNITSTPSEMLVFARGRGNSMDPTIRDNDMVLIDLSQKSVREQDEIWALTVGEIAMIRRVRVRGETVTLFADNDRVPPDQATPDEVNVVGRVIFIGRRM